MVNSSELPPIAAGASVEARKQQYAAVLERLQALLEGEDDLVAAMATAACELHHAFDYFHWTGFYRVHPRTPGMLVIGPYQGHLGCLRIPFSRGVCGAAARDRATQLVPDVSKFPGYIACASSTQSEVVVPLLLQPPRILPTEQQGRREQQQREGKEAEEGGAVEQRQRLLAVLDVDSDLPAAFEQEDCEGLEAVCSLLGRLGLQ